MTKVMVTEDYLGDIADAIRGKNGSSDTYTPGQMAEAIASIPTGGITPTGTVNIAQNGTHDVTQYASANVSVQPNLQSKTVNQNGTVLPDAGYDGLSSVVVSVSGGGGGGLTVSEAVVKFVNDYSLNHTIQVIVHSTGDLFFEGANSEYSGYIYNKTSMISNMGLVLLGDFSQGGSNTGNALSDSIANYSGVILQGIYNKTRDSGFNTSILYIDPQLNTAYWTGMKDRNRSYDCNVTFVDVLHCDLSGNKQVIIYGIP